MFSLVVIGIARLLFAEASAVEGKRPNILLAIADDQSWLHTSAYGCKAVSTPGFDRVAALGVLFTNAFSGSPGCSPSRAALLTGRHAWMLEQAGTHASSFPKKYVVYPDLLETSGYWVGLTGKGWGPGNWKISGRSRNPAGPAYNKRKVAFGKSGISDNDYAANFAEFLAEKPEARPFCFWYGGNEPHRVYDKGSGLKAGKKLADAIVPPFLPDSLEVRSDILDYLLEIEHFDEHLARMLRLLHERGELDNTLVIVTSDNGMPFPRAKANCYEFGFHVPLAISWPKRVPGDRVVDDLIGFVDITATILDVAGITHPASAPAPVGRSIMNILCSSRGGVIEPSRNRVYSARERHSASRFNNLGYPQRALRTHELLYIRNFNSERWPAGQPQALDAKDNLGPMHGAYNDIDNGPSLSMLIQGREDPIIGRFFNMAVGQRSAHELYDIRNDSGCLVNLAADPRHAAALRALADELDRYLKDTADPRVIGTGDIWETYPRYNPMRNFPPAPPFELLKRRDKL